MHRLWFEVPREARQRQAAGEKAVVVVATDSRLTIFGCLACPSGYLTLFMQHAITPVSSTVVHTSLAALPLLSSAGALPDVGSDHAAVRLPCRYL